MFQLILLQILLHFSNFLCEVGYPAEVITYYHNDSVSHQWCWSYLSAASASASKTIFIAGILRKPHLLQMQINVFNDAQIHAVYGRPME